MIMSSDGKQDRLCDPEFYDLFKYGWDSVATYTEHLLCAWCHPLYIVFKMIRETSAQTDVSMEMWRGQWQM